MDIKVYRKETVSQPDGDLDVLVPDVIDIYPDFSGGDDVLANCEGIEDEEEVLQEVVLSTIFQRGLDPVVQEDGIQWSEALVGEVSVPELVTQLEEAVEAVSDTASIEFSTVTAGDGKDYLTFSVKAV
jgi:hypothetical protein